MKVCFTGHRKVPKEKFSSIKKRLWEEIEKLIEKGATDFITGGALGFDTIVALNLVALRFKYPQIRLCLYLPCPEQDKLWGEDEKIIYQGLIGDADEVKYISDHYTDKCMLDRNRAMVDDSSVCIAYHDGRARSGTGMTVNYAKKKGLEVINIY